MHQSSPSPDQPERSAESLDSTSANGAAPAGEPTPESTPAPPTDDRRSSPRRRKLLRVQIMDALAGGDAFNGWVVDRSIGGLRLEVEREVEAGSVLKVHNPSAAKAPWIDVRVQSVQVQDDVHYLGCAYVRSPTWEAMMQFG